MVATSGDRLLKPDAVEQLRRLLIPKALVLTPNLPEAAALLDTAIAEDEAVMRRPGPPPAHARRQGGADQGRPRQRAREHRPAGRAEHDRRGSSAERIATRNTHGTGCTLSSAIAAGLAKRHEPHRRRARRQELRHRGDCRRGPAVDRVGVTVRSIIFIASGEDDDPAPIQGASNDTRSREEGLFRAEQPVFSAPWPRLRSLAPRPSAGAW